MRYQFLCGRRFLPPHADPETGDFGGTEQALLHLARALAEAGEIVTIAGATAAPRAWGNIRFTATPERDADLAIALNDARLLPPRAQQTAIWLHNEVHLWRELRRNRLPALLRHRPTAVFVGHGQARAASPLLPFRRRAIIPHGLAAAYVGAHPHRAPPPPRALFTSQAYRGLAPLLDAWRRDIAPSLPGAHFEARIAGADIPRFTASPGITIAPRLPNAAMPDLLRAARVLLAPGHVSETFCLAAAEAIALGVPVITRGWGALAERVAHDRTGFICRSWPDFAARARAVLTDDALWGRLHAACLATPALSWNAAAALWRELPGQ